VGKLGGGKVNRRPKEERSEADFYPTPAYATQALIDDVGIVPRAGGIWEPASGDGAISKVFLAQGFEVESSDLRTDAGIFGTPGLDFLKLEGPSNPGFRHLITNPPYSHVRPFLKHALSMLDSGRLDSVSFLVRLAFLESAHRGAIFLSKPPSRVLVFSKRLPWFNPETRTMEDKSGQFGHIWIRWDRFYKGPTTIGWYLRPT
jgi:hypothetical protein